MKLVRMLSVCLSVMLLTGLAACQSNNANQKESTAAPAAVTQSTGSSENSGKYPEYLNMESEFPIVKEGNDITLKVVVYQDESTGGKAEDLWFWKWAEWKMNVHFDIEQVLSSANEEKKKLMFASRSVPDILLGLYLNTNDIMMYGPGEKQLMAMDTYINQDYTPAACRWFDAKPTLRAAATCPDGHIYTLPSFTGLAASTAGNGRIFLNQAWLETVGMKTPENLDDFISMLRAFKQKDPGKVGSDNVIPLGGAKNGIDPRFYILNAMGFLTTDGKGTSAALRNGEVAIPAGDPLYEEYLKIMITLYNEKLISEDFFTLDTTQVRAQAAEGLIGVIAEPAYLSMAEAYKDWWAVKPLTSKWNDKQQWCARNSYTVGNFAISADCKYPEVAMRFGDFFYTDLGTQYKWLGPVTGTEDTLGMVGGFKVNDDYTMYWPDLEMNTSGDYDYSLGRIAPTFDTALGNGTGCSLQHQNDMHPVHFESAGLKPQFANFDEWAAALNPEDPDDHYRMSYIANLLPYAVDAYPKIIYFTEDQINRINELKTIINDYVAAETAKFITGARPLDEFGTYLDELKGLGIEEYRKYHADTYAKYLSEIK